MSPNTAMPDEKQHLPADLKNNENDYEMQLNAEIGLFMKPSKMSIPSTRMGIEGIRFAS